MISSMPFSAAAQLTTDLRILQAIQQMMLDVIPADPFLPPPLFPQTTLAAPIAVGDRAFTPVDPSQFMAGAPMMIDDDPLHDHIGEPKVIVDGTWDGVTVPIPLSWRGHRAVGVTGEAGFLYPHAAGTRIFSNVFRRTLRNTTNMLDRDYPLVMLHIPSESGQWVTEGEAEPNFQLRLETRISMIQHVALGPDAENLDDNGWFEEVQDRSSRIMNAVAGAFMQRFSLIDRYGEAALLVSDPNSAASALYTKQWNQVIVGGTQQGQTQDLQYAGIAMVPIRGQWILLDK